MAKISPVAEVARKSADVAELWDRVQSGHREGHYYVALFGLRRYDPIHVAEQIQRGFSYAAFERFQRNTDFSYHLLAKIVAVPQRTLARRKVAGRFEPEESDRLARISRVFARALELFEGDIENAREWLTSPVRGLGGRAPIEFASTDVGAIEVENLIGRLEYGIPS
ncbi:MAG: antitoxin Xre/MbcA/ParS toxin-binding domain-containing protein [Gemmatimonadaceae bacterium]